jgi:2-haloacid dehalogenase
MPAIENVDACVFDAYGTLFDVAAAASHCQDELGEQWAPMAQMWRDKQLQYTWLRSLMDEYVPFWQITQDALDYTMSTLGIDDSALRQRLLDVYFKLDAYPEVAGVMQTLKAGGQKVATLSNGSTDMLESAVTNAKLDLDAVISVDRVGIYKPDGRIYQLAVDDLGYRKNVSASCRRILGMLGRRRISASKLYGSIVSANSRNVCPVRRARSSKT